MALARYDYTERTLTFASVGNISYSVEGSSGHFVTPRGVLGSNAPEPRVTETPWPTSLALFSDGIDPMWSWDDYANLETEGAPELARRILDDRADSTDDATVLVVKEAD